MMPTSFTTQSTQTCQPLRCDGYRFFSLGVKSHTTRQCWACCGASAYVTYLAGAKWHHALLEDMQRCQARSRGVVPQRHAHKQQASGRNVRRGCQHLRQVHTASAWDATGSSSDESVLWKDTWAPNPTVQQVMNPAVTLLQDTMTVREAVRLFLEHGISGAPVVDATGALVGVLSEKDIIVEESEAGRIEQYGDSQKRYMSFLELAMSGAQAASSEQRERLHAFLSMTVREIMSSDPISCSPANLVLEAAGTMAMHEVTRLPVVHEGKVIGIITRGDVLQCMIWSMLVAESEDSP